MKGSRTWKKVLAALVVACAVATALFFPQAFGGLIPYKSEGAKYATESLIAIAKPWDFTEMWLHGDAEFKGQASIADMKTAIESYREELGSLTSPGDMRTVSSSAEKKGDETIFKENVHSEASFEKGVAGVDMLVVKTGDTWAMREFLIAPRTSSGTKP